MPKGTVSSCTEINFTRVLAKAGALPGKPRPFRDDKALHYHFFLSNAPLRIMRGDLQKHRCRKDVGVFAFIRERVFLNRKKCVIIE